MNQARTFADHPFWLVGFRPFFALGCVAGGTLPLLWAAIFAGAVPPAPTFALSPAHWHAHEMFFGFGLAMLGGFLLTASKNWVAIRGYHGLPLLLLALAWLLDRVLMALGGGLPALLVLIGGSLFPTALVVMLLATLIRHQANDSYRIDNRYFILALPLLLPAKWFLLTDSGFATGVTMSVAIFRLAFLLMLERTLTQFMRSLLKVDLWRSPWFDHLIKSSGLLLVFSPWLPIMLAMTLELLLAGLLTVRWLAWKPWTGLRRIDVGIMYLGLAAIIVHLLLDGVALLHPLPWIGSSILHIFTVGAMGLIIPAMIVRIACGHTGRKVEFTARDKAVLWLMLAGLGLRVAMPQLVPTVYPFWISAAAACWTAAFMLLAWRYLPWLWQPRADGRQH